MNLGHFLELIEKKTKDIPNREELEVIFATDEEGNEYKKVYFEPTLCKVDSASSDSTYIIAIEMFDEGNIDKSEINAICIT